jgi:C_GCAxxG_C_C family probable redox protein
MLVEKAKSYFPHGSDFNCAESMLHAANDEYELGLTHESMKLSAGFGGGMAIGNAMCGALSAGIMALGKLFVEDRAHESDRIKKLTKEFLETFKEKMGDLDCTPLKEKYYEDKEVGNRRCYKVVYAAAEVLDAIVTRELAKTSMNDK